MSSQFFNYAVIQEKKRNHDYINLIMLSRAIVEELKVDRYKNFPRAEELFKDVEQMRGAIRFGTEFYLKDVHAYQRALTSIVRYATTPEKSLEYATFFFTKLEEPIRTPTVELIVLTNLLFVFGQVKTQKYMDQGLSLIKLVLDIGVFELDDGLFGEGTGRGPRFNNPIEVFETVAKKVLNFHKLQFSADRKELVRLYSHTR